MKIRNGFVSNSSSSSFVIAGLLLDDALLTESKKREMIITSGKMNADAVIALDEDSLWDAWHDNIAGGNNKITVFQGGDDGITDGKFMIGKVLLTINSEGGSQWDMEEIGFNSLNLITEDIKKLSGFVGAMRIIGTTRSC